MDIIIAGNSFVLKTMYKLHSDERLALRGEFKPSAFNVVSDRPGAHVIFNTLCNALVRLNDLEYAKLLGEKKCGQKLAHEFMRNGIAVKSEVDERSIYKKWRELARRNANYLSVNVTTTLNCNARCEYCYEAGVRHEDFSKDKLESLVKFIVKRKVERPIKINWFGGEPLLRPDVIDYVCRRLDEESIEFKSYLITNGSLITKKLVETKFPRWRMTDVQITLDGTEKIYEARKKYVDRRRGSFKKILDKIETASTKAIVHVRLNVDNRNAEDVLELIKILQARFADNANVTYYPAFLTGTGDKFSEERKVGYVKKMFERLNNPRKMGLSNRLYSPPRTLACMRNDPNSYSIDVSGRIYSCEHEVGRPERSIGTLNRIDQSALERLANVPLREECEACEFLPKCMGGCSINLETNDSPCMIERYIIRAYVELLNK